MFPLIYAQVFAAGLCLLALARFFYSAASFFKLTRASQRSIVDQINHLLPQTQCGQCGHKGCRPYARAISEGEAINKCPPGGDETIQGLARLLNESPRELDPAHGQTSNLLVASIREDECIGCTKCIQACPVDAILGAAKLMHTVIESECTGCDLCVEPCPVDCIDMINTSMPSESQYWPFPDRRLAAPLQRRSSP